MKGPDVRNLIREKASTKMKPRVDGAAVVGLLLLPALLVIVISHRFCLVIVSSQFLVWA